MAALIPKAPSGSRTHPVAPHRRSAEGAARPVVEGGARPSRPTLTSRSGYASLSGPVEPPRAQDNEPHDVTSGQGADGKDESFKEIEPSELVFAERVGTGATAEVFRGFWEGNQVAIKEIYLQRKDAKSELKQQVAFAREIAVMSRVSHENLVKFLGASLAHRPLRVVTEFCEGDTLFTLLHDDEDDEVDLIWPQKLKMCLDIARAMNYLHTFSPQIIHRDLKSLNLLLAHKVEDSSDVPVVKVSDFGLARMKDADDNSVEWNKMTKEAGTCHWMAPEVPTGKYTEKADVYSYAMVTFEILCREIPFEEAEAVDVLKLVMRGDRPCLKAVPPDCPRKLEDMMVSCWVHRPEDRPSFVEILKILNSVKL